MVLLIFSSSSSLSLFHTLHLPPPHFLLEMLDGPFIPFSFRLELVAFFPFIFNVVALLKVTSYYHSNDSMCFIFLSLGHKLVQTLQFKPAHIE